jgi:hypothetical protein
MSRRPPASEAGHSVVASSTHFTYSASTLLILRRRIPPSPITSVESERSQLTLAGWKKTVGLLGRPRTSFEL